MKAVENQRLQQSLKQRFQMKQCPHFLNISSRAQDEDSARLQLEGMALELVHSMAEYPKYANLEQAKSNLDILVLCPPEGQNYQVEQLAEFFEFIELKSFSGKSKFCIFRDAHRLTETLCNKLLKVLEEPPKDNFIFFLNPTQQSFLSTVESRGGKISLPQVNETPNHTTLETLSEILGRSKANDEHWVKAQLDQGDLAQYNFEQLEQLMDSLRHFAKMRLYHNSPKERLVQIAEKMTR